MHDDVTNLLTNFAERGIRATLDNGTLHCGPRRLLTPEDKRLIARTSSQSWSSCAPSKTQKFPTRHQLTMVILRAITSSNW
jgi:hypothetical protein